MAVEVGSPLLHVPPCAERVVAEHNPYAVDHQFRLLLNALPAIAVGDSGLVIVTGDEVLASMKHAQQAIDTPRRLANDEMPRCQISSSGLTTEFQRSIISGPSRPLTQMACG
jgi:hypothetical protein